MTAPRLWLGVHRPNWLEQTDVPLFLSRSTLKDRRTFPRARGDWVLDSGGFTELHDRGEWSVSERDYAAEVQLYASEIGGLAWAAPMDWMCEPSVRARTGLSVEEHQRRTLRSFLVLRELLGGLVVPVLQGWETEDYLRAVEQYERAGIDLNVEPIVGVGSICRRSADLAIGRVVRALAPLRLHAFGVRGSALRACADVLTSADSMAWSYRGRFTRLPGHTHKTCANCLPFALRWRADTLAGLQQLRLS